MWQLNPQGYSNLNELNIQGKLSIGTQQEQEQDLSIQRHHSVSLGDAGFLYSSGATGTMSFNEYSVLIEGKKEHKLHNIEDHGACMRLSNDGTVNLDATAAPGDLKMKTLFVVDSIGRKVQFGKYAEFGLQGDESTRIPLRVKGASGQAASSTVAFGATTDAYGHLGSNDDRVMLTTTDGKKSISLDHSSGKVGFGTHDMTEDLTMVSNNPDAVILLSGRSDPSRSSSVTMKNGGSMKLSASKTSSNSGKLLLKEFDNIQFSDSQSQQGGTVFDRAGANVADKKGPAGTTFMSGKVGVGLDNPQRLLHVNGDTWWQGKLYITKGFAQDLMESESFIEEGESTTTTHEDPRSDTSDVITMLEKLAHVVRQNKLRLRNQMESITQMERQVLNLLSR